MADRFPGIPCVLCCGTSVGVGEHVWPSWFIEDFHGEGPFTTEKAGKVLTKRDRVTPSGMSALPGAHVPMCSTCNTFLGRTIETKAKEIVRRLVPLKSPHSWPTLSPEECETLAKWLLKVGLLSAHPEVVHDRPQLNSDNGVPRFACMPPEWLDWMRTGATPPDGFSVFVSRRGTQDPGEFNGERRRIILPRVVVDGAELRFMSRAFGVRGLEVVIVWHPGWLILHPLVSEGRAALLWPTVTSVDFKGLPEVHPREFMFVDGSIGQMRFGAASYKAATIDPLSCDFDPLSAFFGDALID